MQLVDNNTLSPASMFSTPTSWPTPSAASGDKGLGGGSPVFPSPTKLQNNGLDGKELGTETNPLYNVRVSGAVWNIYRYATGILIVLILFRGGMVWWYLQVVLIL